MPISYSPDNGQHYHQLKVYKSPTSPNQLALFRLAVLYTMFMNAHQRCLERVVGGPFTHVTNVPSTRARTAMHPLQVILTAAHPSLPRIDGQANASYGNVREFIPDRFHVPAIAGHNTPKVLLLEDLWVTGARAQSMAHALRAAGAAVVIVALGRQLNHGYRPVQPLLDAARGTPFDLSRCTLDDLSV